MKMRFVILLALAAARCASLSWAGELTWTVDFKASDLVIAKTGGFDVVDLKGCPVSADPGKPRLPRLVQPLVIPAGAAVRSVELVSTDEQTLSGKYNLIPVQRNVPLPMPGKQFPVIPPVPDQEVYGRDAVYPPTTVRPLGTGTMCGYSIGQVEVNPLRYNPATGMLTLATKITFRVVYDEVKTAGTTPTARQKEEFGRQVRALVANPRSVDLCAPRVASVNGAQKLSAGDYQYVIISGRTDFDTVFQRLADWKTSKGVPATLMRMDDIVAGYTGSDNADKVRNFIIDAVNTWGTLYVLLGGQGDDLNSGQNLIPCRHAYYVTCGAGLYTDENNIPSDLYYSDLDGTWNANGNSVWGELADGVDMYSDVYVGRAPVLTVAQAQNFVAKTLKYEQDPPSGYIKKMLLPAGVLWASYEERSTQRCIMQTTPAGWTDDSLFQRDGNLTEVLMINHFNEGRGLGHWMGHGDENGVYASGSAYYSSADAAAAGNGDKQGITVSIACFNGAIDEVSGGDCLAEHLINRTGGGNVGVLMNSRYGWGAYVGTNYVMGPDEMIDTTFFHILFLDGNDRLGPLYSATRNAWVPYADSANQYNYTRWCLYEKNLFGDPELPVWTNEPESLAVSHDPVVRLGPGSFTVLVADKNSGAPLAGALVCARFRDGSVYAYGATDASGVVSLNIDPARQDSLLVTATARDHYPHYSYALTVSDGPYVGLLRCAIDDASGNNDGVANPGETVRLPAWVKNYGTATAYAVVATLRTASPGGSVTADSVFSYGTLAAGDSACHSDGFGAYVNPSDMNGVIIPLSLTCMDADDSAWVSSLYITVGTAVLAYNGRTIDGNGRLDPNENATMAVGLNNDGFGYVYNGQAVLRCADARITVTDSTATYETIGPGDTGTSGLDSFALSAGDMPPGTVVTFTAVMKADGVADRQSSWSETVGDQCYLPSPDNTTGGPRYYAIEDSDAVSRSPQYDWAGIRDGGGTQLTMSDDGASQVLLPFAFTWYGNSYNRVTVCSNGWMAFGNVTAPSSYWNHVHLPSSATYVPRPAVFALWDDLNPSVSGSWVGYKHDAVNHRFIVEFDSVPFIGTTTTNSFEYIICDSTGSDSGGCLRHDVVVQYKTWNDRGLSGIGAQSASGLAGLDLFYNGATGNSGLVLGFYTHKAIRYSESPSVLGVSDNPSRPESPGGYRLAQAYPNPTRCGAVISYAVPQRTPIELCVYNIIGQKVRVLENGVKQAGCYTVHWDGRDDVGRKATNGVYFCKLTANRYCSVKKMVVLE